jgi:hypothetical protein
VNTDNNEVFPQAPSPTMTSFLQVSLTASTFKNAHLRIASLDRLGCPDIPCQYSIPENPGQTTLYFSTTHAVEPTKECQGICEFGSTNSTAGRLFGINTIASIQTTCVNCNNLLDHGKLFPTARSSRCERRCGPKGKRPR